MAIKEATKADYYRNDNMMFDCVMLTFPDAVSIAL